MASWTDSILVSSTLRQHPVGRRTRGIGVREPAAECAGSSLRHAEFDEFWEGMFSWMLCSGNAYAEIDWINGRPSSLMPIPSTHVTPIRKA
ncbi:hypothetical protein DPM13_08865 [Paracoccus mutanolyticus]|uniref:Uncharacterized protein n=1 Tax=Paracoccus mutanolyticus TaxID=1499308 RepID=A0ABM6WRL5_9RHOB|nr:hypothetical protein [Paracoccus mutanolyticus]AWX93209.1 hypothetical protein DPM13_08865 [Paracoccus mutanolyticus]